MMKMKGYLSATDLENENVLPLTKTREKIYFVLKYHKNLVTVFFLSLYMKVIKTGWFFSLF